CARRSRLVTWSCSPAARRRVRAISPTASCRSWATSSSMASRSSRASRSASPSSTASRSLCCRAFPPPRSSPSTPSLPPLSARAVLAVEASRIVESDYPVRFASDLGRKEFVLVALVAGEDRPVAFPITKGSGAVTSFSQADGFLEIDALAPALDAGTRARVTLIGSAAAIPDLVVMGSHCIALHLVLGGLAERGLAARTIAVGSIGGVAAAERGECDLAPVHLVDPASGVYNAHLLRRGLALVK